jgi:hypothetical protein
MFTQLKFLIFESVVLSSVYGFFFLASDSMYAGPVNGVINLAIVAMYKFYLTLKHLKVAL